jgi:hypothetical protein
MGKSIKLVTIVGDEEVVVGRCHPGQARILRKAGMAEWKKDRLVLLQGPSTSEFGKEDSNWKGRSFPDWESAGAFLKSLKFQNSSWQGEIEEIDPEGELMASAWDMPGYNQEGRLKPEEVVCETLSEWVGEAVRRRKAGHFLLESDAPKRLMLGFVDDDDNKAFYLGLRKLKTAGERDLAEFSLTVAEIGTNEGRRKLLGLDPEDVRPSYTAVEPDPELEALWVQEVEDTLGAEIREGEQIRLADEWARRLKVILPDGAD